MPNTLRQARRDKRRDRRQERKSQLIANPPRTTTPPEPSPQPTKIGLGSFGNASIDQWDDAFFAAAAAVFAKKGVHVDPRFMKAMMDVESGHDGNLSPDWCRRDGSCGPMQIKPENHQWRCPECDFATVQGQIELATHIIGDTMKAQGGDEYGALLAEYFPTDDVINGTTQAQYADRVRQLVHAMRVNAAGGGGGNQSPLSGDSPVTAFLGCVRGQIGKTYVHATAGPNTFDCSGLVDFCYRKATGETIPGGRGSWLQCNQAGRALGKITPAQMHPGDLLCFLDGQHVGVYEGNNVMINALNENEGVKRNDITTPYWQGNYDGARRLF